MRIGWVDGWGPMGGLLIPTNFFISTVRCSIPHPTSFTHSHSQTSDPVEILEENTYFNSLSPPPSFLLKFSFRYFDPTNIGWPLLFGLPNSYIQGHLFAIVVKCFHQLRNVLLWPLERGPCSGLMEEGDRSDCPLPHSQLVAPHSERKLVASPLFHNTPRALLFSQTKWSLKSPNCNVLKKTSQELQMLSSVTLNCQVTKIVMSSGSQLSELYKLDISPTERNGTQRTFNLR